MFINRYGDKNKADDKSYRNGRVLGAVLCKKFLSEEALDLLYGFN